MILSAASPFLNTFDPVSLEEMDRLKFMDRVDTKFILPAVMLPALLENLNENYKILEIDQQRSFKYDTRYLDTAGFLFYNQHVRGKLARHKIRCRRYEATGGEFFEIKMKTNKGRTKKWRIRSDFNRNTIDGEISEFIEKHIPYSILPLGPVLNNKFIRITLAGTGTNERITFDHDISFSTMSGKLIELPFLAIAELKSEGFYKQSPFIAAARNIGIRPSGFSKYCVGSALLMDMPRKNILKPKLLLLKKIENEYSKSDCS
jgi:hypothetical protein